MKREDGDIGGYKWAIGGRLEDYIQRQIKGY
jgi:hypothetical protein